MGVPAWEWTIWRPRDIFWILSHKEEGKEAVLEEPPSGVEALSQSHGRECGEEQGGQNTD